jgi:hypothetical protein
MARELNVLGGEVVGNRFAAYLKAHPSAPATDKTARLARGFLKEYGVGLDIPAIVARGRLTPMEAARVGQLVERDISFWYLAGDLPKFMQSHIGKTATQFMPSAYLQSAFVLKVLLKMSQYDPLIPFKWALISLATGEVHRVAKDIYNLTNPLVATNRGPGLGSPEEAGRRALSDITVQGAGVGVATLPFELLKYGRAERVLGGPTASTLGDLFTAGRVAASKKMTRGAKVRRIANLGMSQFGAATPVREFVKAPKDRQPGTILPAPGARKRGKRSK